MNLEQLKGRHTRLERELAAAFSALPWPAARIERLADELAETEREIAQLRAAGLPHAGQAASLPAGELRSR